KTREIGNIWTRELAASARIAPSRLDRVLYYPIAGRPACYRVAVMFTPPGKQANAALDERSATRCDRIASRAL
ncbi:MAG TPA: hypothetical protein VNT42_00445, partial [Sphingomonas sp.]|nr:hypothetical protein [Sphingomonas sp.]